MPVSSPIKPYQPFRTLPNRGDIEGLPDEGVILPPEKPAWQPGTAAEETAEIESPTPGKIPPPPRPPEIGEAATATGRFTASPTENPLTAAPESTATRTNPWLLLAFFIAFLVLGGVGLYSYFNLQPKLRALSLAKGLEKPTSATAGSLKEVETSLTQIVNLLTQGTTGSPSTPQSGRDVLGAEKSLTPGAIEDEYTRQLRTLKEASLNAQTVVGQAKKNMDEFENRVPENYPEIAQSLITEAASLSQRGQKTLFESQKVAAYYSQITSIEIDLWPTIKSLILLIADLTAARDPSIYSGKVASLKKTVADLETQTRGLNNILPDGLEKVQEDNLAAFIIINNFLKDLEESIGKGSYRQFASSVQKLAIDVEVLSSRAKTLELSFWQDSGLVKKTASLSDEFGNLSTKIAGFKKSLALPFLN